MPSYDWDTETVWAVFTVDIWRNSRNACRTLASWHAGRLSAEAEAEALG